MFTDCPDCHRQFRINAEQLSAAGGRVQCGFCGRQFDALQRLRDRPLGPGTGSGPSATISDEVLPDEALPDEAEPEFDIPGLEPDPAPPESPEPLPPMAGVELPSAADLEPVPAPPRTLWRWLWGAGSVLLLLAVLSQLAWYNRDALLSRYPGLLPWARKVCAVMQCDLIRHRDVTAIKLLNRDVQEHPRYEHALLVNATMSNQLSTIQPYPVIQLVLFDINGKQIAYRNFQPQEYLDASIPIDDGMPPGRPVHFVLEVTGQTESAVGFKFNFL